MKILIDIRVLGRGTQSGIPLFTRELIDRLITKRDDSFELFYPGRKKAGLPAAWAKTSGVSVLDWRIPNKVLDIGYRLFNKPDISDRAAADVILSPHFNSLNPGKLPRVLVVHDLSFIRHPNFFSFRQRFWHWLQDWRRQMTTANHLIAVSEYTKADLMESLSIPEKKISVVYPGISERFRQLDPHDTALLRFQKIHEIRTPYFLYFGAIEQRKNITQLIAAFELLRTNPRFKGYRLVIAGTPGKGAHAIERAIRQTRSQDVISIISRITDEERIFLYNGAVAFICTSFFEGFGFPALEAQACGTPVIASDRTSFPETLGKSAILVDPWKTAQLAQALTAVAADEATRLRLLSAGLANAARFNWNRTADQVHEILKKTYQSAHES